MRINTINDLAKFQQAASMYFDYNQGLTWKQFCEGLKDFDKIDL